MYSLLTSYIFIPVNYKPELLKQTILKNRSGSKGTKNNQVAHRTIQITYIGKERSKEGKESEARKFLMSDTGKKKFYGKCYLQRKKT